MAFQAQFVHFGDYIDFTPGSAVAVGQVVVQGNLVGVSRGDIDANAVGALALVGVFDVVKAAGAGVTFAVGAIAYWDDANNVAVATDGSGAHKPLGTVVKVAADADASVRVRLGQ